MARRANIINTTKNPHEIFNFFQFPVRQEVGLILGVKLTITFNNCTLHKVQHITRNELEVLKRKD